MQGQQPGSGDWPSHPMLKAKAGVGSTSYLHGLRRMGRSPSPLLLSARTQEPREFLGGETGLKSLVGFTLQT